MKHLAWGLVVVKAGMHLLAAYLHTTTRGGLSDAAVHAFYRANQVLFYGSLVTLGFFLLKKRHQEALVLGAGCHVLYGLEAMHHVRQVAEHIVETGLRVAGR